SRACAVGFGQEVVEVLRQAADRRVDLRDSLRLGLRLFGLLWRGRRRRRALRLLDLLWRRLLRRLSISGLDHHNLGAARACGHEARRAHAARAHFDLRPIARDDWLYAFTVLAAVSFGANAALA